MTGDQALQLALYMIENYQIDIRNEGLDKKGFCQGEFYQRSQRFLDDYCKKQGIEPLVEFQRRAV